MQTPAVVEIMGVLVHPLELETVLAGAAPGLHWGIMRDVRLTSVEDIADRLGSSLGSTWRLGFR